MANFTPYFVPKRCIYTVFCKVFTIFLSLAGFSSAPTSIFAHLHLNVLLLCTRDLAKSAILCSLALLQSIFGRYIFTLLLITKVATFIFQKFSALKKLGNVICICL